MHVKQIECCLHELLCSHNLNSAVYIILRAKALKIFKVCGWPLSYTMVCKILPLVGCDFELTIESISS